MIVEYFRVGGLIVVTSSPPPLTQGGILNIIHERKLWRMKPIFSKVRRIESLRLRFQIWVSERFFCYEWMTSLFIFKLALQTGLLLSSMRRFFRNHFFLIHPFFFHSNEKRTRPFFSSLKSVIQSQCGALKKLNPRTLKQIDQKFDLGFARSDPCLLNRCTPGYVCWENPMRLSFPYTKGKEERKRKRILRFMGSSKKGDRERGTDFPSIKESLPIHSVATDRRQFCRCC